MTCRKDKTATQALISGLIGIIFFLGFFLFKSTFNPKIPNPKSQIPNNIQNSKFKIQNFFILLILAGAISNIIDRFYFGCVIDFIDLKIWPVFNLADIFISVGAIAIIIKTLKHKTRSS